MSNKINNNLDEKLKNHMELLTVLCNSYDYFEKDILAISIAVSIRVLVYDTKQSASLLKHLNLKEINFLSTINNKPQKGNFLGLVRRINVGVKDGIGGEAKYWALCSEKYFPTKMDQKYINFDKWWEETILKSESYSLTRKDLVIAISNKDGGAHYDKEVDEKYNYFRNSSSGGSSLKGKNSKEFRGYDNIPTYASIRQIGYEVIETIKNIQPCV